MSEIDFEYTHRNFTRRNEITDYSDHREIIRFLSKGMGIPFKRIALNSNIHSSYFSRVMQGNSNFSQEQLFQIGQCLDLDGWRLEYFLLLGESEASGNYRHKEFINEKIEGLRKSKQRLLNRLDQATETSANKRIDYRLYYEDVVTAKIHMFLTIDRFQKNPHLICKVLNLSENRLEQEFEKLRKLGIVEGGRTEPIKLLNRSVHLDESNPASVSNHVNWRLDAIANLKKLESEPSDYHLSATFSTDEATKILIKEEFKKFVSLAQELSMKTKNEEQVYTLLFDLYE